MREGKKRRNGDGVFCRLNKYTIFIAVENTIFLKQINKCIRMCGFLKKLKRTFFQDPLSRRIPGGCCCPRAYSE